MDNRVLPLIIVDDESLAREHIRRSVDWEELKLEIAGEAANGPEALELLHSTRPAVAIVDINIPVIDGLVVSERIRTEQPECKVVILSGFDEFDYARKALRAGVLEYVLKPLRSDELRDALTRARDAHLEDISRRRELHLLRQRDRSEDEATIESSFAALLTGTPDQIDESALEVATRHLPSLAPDARVAVVAIDGREDRWPDIHEQNRWHTALCQIIREHGAADAAPVILGPDGLPVFVVSSRASALAVVDRVASDVSRRFSLTISAGIGSPIGGWRQVPGSYRAAIDALRETFFTGPASVTTAPVPERAHAVIVPNKSDVLLPLRLGHFDEIVGIINAAIARVERESLDYDSVELMVMEMTAAAAQFLAELDRELDPLLDGPTRPWRTVARSRETLSELRDWLVHVFELVMEEARDDTRFKTYRVVDRAAEYIRSNYQADELNLRAIADAGSVNPTYLSKVFKIQTGQSVIEFLRETRLNAAKDIMDGSRSMRVNEVARAVGFADPLYFSKVFKARFGVSPRRYLRR
jgi:two-component system response regulator YesN